MFMISPFVYVETKEKFNTLKLSASANDDTYIDNDMVVYGKPDIKFNQIVFINDTKEIYTHGGFYCQQQS